LGFGSSAMQVKTATLQLIHPPYAMLLPLQSKG